MARPAPSTSRRASSMLAGELTTSEFLLAAPVFGAAIIALGSASIYFSTPTVHYAAWWPAAGVAVGLLILTPPRRYWAAAAVVFAATFLGNALAGREADLSAWYGVGNALEAVVVASVLSLGYRRRPRLATLEDVGLLFAASGAGAAVLGAWAGLGVWWLNGGSFPDAFYHLTASHAAAVAVIAPFFLVGRADSVQTARWGETAVQFSLLAGVTLAAYGSTDGLPVAFAPMPFLVWAALRLAPRAVSLELLTVGVIAVLMTHAGRGPFGGNEALVAESPLLVTFLLQSSILSAALVALPLMVAAKQRRNALHDAQETRDELLNVVNSAHGIAIISAGMDGMIEFWSAGARRIFGYDEEEVVGIMRVPQLHDDEAEPRDFGEIARVMEEEQERFLAFDRDYRRKDGTVFTGHIRVSRRLGRRGELIGLMGVVEDVSEERHAQASLRAALQREHEAVERLAALDRSKNDFIASVSHELRTPITSVIGYADLLMSREISDDQLTLLEPVLRNARRLELLIEDLLAVSRMDNGTFVYRPAPMDLSDTVRAAVDTASLLLADRRLSLNVELPEVPVRTVGDSAQIQRALANLVSNAIKFTRDGGSIDIVVEPLGDKVEISVADTGMGIPDYEQSKIFDRFFRSPRANEDAVAGTGLGLYIVDQIVRAHSGSVSFKSVEGKGTTFIVTLPLRRP